MSEGYGSTREEPQRDQDAILQELLIGALQVGDLDQMLVLASDLLKAWPLQRIRNSAEWRILAALSQVGSDQRRLGLAASEISRKVALTARLSYFKTNSDYDIVCRTVSLSAFEEVSLDQVMRCLAVNGDISHYAAARLGLAGYRQKDPEIVALCIRRASRIKENMSNLADPHIELAFLTSCHNILLGRDPQLDKLVQLWRNTRVEFRERYYNSLCILIDPEDLQYGY